MNLQIENYQGHACKKCGEIIKVYSRSGLCRKCWHKRYHPNRKTRAASPGVYCEICGRPIWTAKRCLYCIEGPDLSYLSRYRTIGRDGGVWAEHRYVYSRQVGPIPQGFVIHHLNGLKGDNRIANLFATRPQGHNGNPLIPATQRRIRELEGRLDAKR